MNIKKEMKYKKILLNLKNDLLNYQYFQMQNYLKKHNVFFFESLPIKI